MTAPLDGCRVVELAGIGPAPMACTMLADFGCDVIRVVRPHQSRDVAAPVTTRGRSTVEIDLKTDAGISQLLDLIELADVLVDPFRPGVTERLGVGPETCMPLNERLVYARMTGWGQKGPWAQMAGHDINYIATSGALNAIGRKDGPPQPPLNLLGDFGGGTMFLLLGIVAALYERERSGRGQVVDAAIVDGTAWLSSYIFGMMANGSWVDERGVNRLDTGAPFYDVYETSDRRWIAVGAIEPKFFAELVRLLELPEAIAQQDRDSWPALRRQIADRMKERSFSDWAAAFEATDACAAPVLTWSEAVNHPHLVSRGTYLPWNDMTSPAPAPRLSRTPASHQGPEKEVSVQTAIAHWVQLRGDVAPAAEVGAS